MPNFTISESWKPNQTYMSGSFLKTKKILWKDPTKPKPVKGSTVYDENGVPGTVMDTTAHHIYVYSTQW